MLPLQLALPILALILTALLCGAIRHLLVQKQILDIPNDRSMHAIPVPRGGGLAVWLAVLPLWLGLLIYGGLAGKYIWLIVAFLLLAGVSWADDRKALPAKLRFGVQVVAVVLGLLQFDHTLLIFQGALPLWLDRIIAAFCWLWFINLTNFMDGIDGLTGAEGLHISFGAVALLILSALPLQGELYFALLFMGAMMGFLLWNWHPAKLFIGDVGSIPMGFMLGYLLLQLAGHGFLAQALVLPLYYVADASLTLGWRILYGFKFWQPHRMHFYQRAALKAGPKHVVASIMLCNLGLLGLAVFHPIPGSWLVFAGALLVAALLWYLNRLANKV